MSVDLEKYLYVADDVVELACEIGYLLERLDPKVSSVMDNTEESMDFYNDMGRYQATDEQSWAFVNDYEDSINALDVVRDAGAELQHHGLELRFWVRQETE
jgi:hypothetical protein